jgi:hypothetical protein
LYFFCRQDDASSYPIGVILLVAITFLLGILVLLMVQIQPFTWNTDKDIPVIFTITAIESVDEITGHLNYDSRLTLLHTGNADYQNRNLKIKFLKNGQPLACAIPTLNGHDFISTSHNGIQWMGGSGCSGTLWSPGERICIDFSDGTFRRGDRVQMDVIDKVANVTISRHEYLYE